MNPSAALDALSATFTLASIETLIQELTQTTPNTALHRLAAARALAGRGALPTPALVALASALADVGSVNMEPDIIPDPYMTPPEAIHYETVSDAALATLAEQAGRAIPAVCDAFLRRQAYSYQLHKFLASLQGEELLAVPEPVLSDAIAVILSADRLHQGQASVSILSWARTEQQNPDPLLAQLVCPIGQVRATAAIALATRDREAALPHLLRAAQDTDAEAVCGVVRALHSLIQAQTPLDDGALNTLERLAATHSAAAEMVKVCEMFERLGTRAQFAATTLQLLADRAPLDVYDTHTRAVGRAAARALRAMTTK